MLIFVKLCKDKTCKKQEWPDSVYLDIDSRQILMLLLIDIHKYTIVYVLQIIWRLNNYGRTRDKNRDGAIYCD